MARPPIIISNGGIASALTKGLKAAPGENPDGKDPAVIKIIMANLAELNNRITGANPNNEPIPKARTLRGGGTPASKNEAKIYWRLENDRAHTREVGLDAR
ncbi:MAG: hypothetical protein IIA61_05900 [Candidatus Marinimicrobia bacterium]|nr:hypothetical protein [Candidatus Neomarinimicrobiota bacterium]